MVNLILPFLRGNNWIKIYLRIAGAKIGKGVFVNSKHIYDAYLLELKNDVLIGGEVFLNCHLFEGGNLVLGKIVLAEGTTVGARAYITPGVQTGKNSKVGMDTYIRRNTKTNDGEAIVAMPGMNARAVIKLMQSMQSKKSGDKK
jgi:acetyltransferase-like isoleucine patch superfamily enzyme